MDVICIGCGWNTHPGQRVNIGQDSRVKKIAMRRAFSLPGNVLFVILFLTPPNTVIYLLPVNYKCVASVTSSTHLCQGS